MPIDDLTFVEGYNLDDTRFTAQQILEAEAIVAEFISARNSTLDVSLDSNLHDLLVREKAILFLTARDQIAALQATQSLKGITDNPELASEKVLDAILSNYLITRKSGARARGTIRVNVSRSGTYSLSSGTQFVSSSGLVFVTEQAWRASVDPETDIPSNVSPLDAAEEALRLYPSDASSGQHYFLVPVVAAEVGSKYALSGQNQFTVQPRPANFISAFSFGSFLGAVEPESNQQLIERIPSALSARNLVSRYAISSSLVDKFQSAIVSVGVAGVGDSFLLRGSENILGLKIPGFTDIWVRTSASLIQKDVGLVASLESIESDRSAQYSVEVGVDAFPGHYFVTAVRPGTSSGLYPLGSYVIEAQVKGMATSPNKIDSIAVGAYSRFQKSTVVFSVPPNADGIDHAETLDVVVTVAGQEGIAEIQDYVSDPMIRSAAIDQLVRAVIPCFISLSPITVYCSADTKPDEIRKDIYDYINAIPAGGDLNLDRVVESVRKVSGVTQIDLPLLVAGRIYPPSGEPIDIVSNNRLEIPVLAERQVAPDTTSFFVDTADIHLSLIVG